MSNFKLVSDFKPTGDQPAAIENLTKGLQNGLRHQTLLGATGTGKTFAMANIIQKIQKPTLVLAHNKTLAAQLCAEFQQFFPENAVSYFVSYYDYYQPEAYLARTDTFIEKEATINDEIAKFRHAATVNLLTRNDVIIVSSVSCIYGLGDVENYEGLAFKIKPGDKINRVDLMRRLTEIQYQRTRSDLKRGMFEVLGDVLTIFCPHSDNAFQLEFWGDDLDKISEIDAFTGEMIRACDEITIFPAAHEVQTPEKIERACIEIEKDLVVRENELRKLGRPLEAHRLHQRVTYDLEMLRSMGYVNGIENYTRYFSGKNAGDAPETLLDYFPKDFLCFVDESHISIPQIGGMFNGNLSRKENLINYGFRLPSAFDNRPLKFDEFESKISRAIYVSATPGKYEFENTPPENVVEQIIRPTGLLDPEISVRPSTARHFDPKIHSIAKADAVNAIDDVLAQIKQTIAGKDRVLITTVTKKSAEDLSDYLIESGIKAKYLHSEIDTLERIEILTELRSGKIEVVVGINLLREGLDLPEVALICILDADKAGFLRSRDSLLQIIGRAARNEKGRVIFYADFETPAMIESIAETNRRRSIQQKYNEENKITPQTIKKEIVDISRDLTGSRTRNFDKLTKNDQIQKMIKELNSEMDLCVQNLDFERAAVLRDEVAALEKRMK